MKQDYFRGLLTKTLSESNVTLTTIPYDEGCSCGGGAAMAAMGYCENYLRLPLTKMEEGNKAKLLKLMAEQGLI